MSLRKIKPTTSKRRNFETRKTETVKSFPKFSISLKNLPEAKDWPVDGNKKYYITLELDMIELSIREKKESDGLNNFDLDFSNRAEFNITGLEVLPSKQGSSHERFSRRKNG